jgi:hypothetical protein
MYCSNCGADNQSPDAYCKRCGEWLPDIKGRRGIAFGGETPQQNLFTGLFMSALSTVAALFSAIALYATYLGNGDTRWSVYVAAAFCVCIAGWQASSFVVSLRLTRRLRKARQESASVSEIDPARAARALNPGDLTDFVTAPGAPRPPLSVAEPTTKNLDLSDGETL